MTHKCLNPKCFHKASDHTRTIVESNGRITRPFHGYCKIKDCNCEAFTLYLKIEESKTKKIFKLRNKFKKETRPEFKKVLFKQIVSWWKEFEEQYEIPIKTVQSINSDGRVLFKSK